MKKRRVILILLVLAAAGAGAWYWFYGRMNGATNRILVSGNLELTQVDLSFKTAGRMTELAVREGQFVKKGDLIARLDFAQLDQQLLRDQAAIASAQSSLQQLQTSIEYQGATIDSDISTRRAELAQAQARLDELMAGSRPQEIQQAQSAVADAKAWNEQARADMERAQTLFAREDISRSQFDQARAKLDSTAAQLRQAEERLGLVQEGPRKEEIAGARAQVARAQAAVQTAQANRIELRRKQEELAARRAEIDRTRAQAGMTQTQIADATVVAPIDGVVLVKASEAGEVIAAGSTIVSLGDLSHPWLRAYINETDLGRIKLGDKVQLSTDSFPGKTYEGRISFISSEAEFTPKQIQTKEERVKLVYRIKIDVDNSHQELKNNMPVDGEILYEAAMIIVAAQGLTRRFGTLTAVNHLDLEVEQGEIFALVGPDGAGKTTTMRLLCGLMDPTEGKAIVGGHDVSKEPDAVKDQIGYMAQRFGLYGDLTVNENMAFYGDLFGILGREREELTGRLLQMTRMEPFRKRQAAKLSGGMKQKLALMCTLLHKPKVLFLDEPTNGVDPVSRRDFWAILYQLISEGLTVLVSTAYMDEAERANRVGMMHQGRMIRCDSPAALKENLEETCYRVHFPHPDEARPLLERQPGVLGVHHAGVEYHLFVDERVNTVENLLKVTPFTYQRIVPSLEDVFIALARKEELARAA